MPIHIPRSFIAEYRPARSLSPFVAEGWWLNPWPALGWAETVLKVAAWFMVPMMISPSYYPFVPPTHLIPQVKQQLNIMIAAEALLVAAIFDRIFYREIISMIFVFPNNFAHFMVCKVLWDAVYYGKPYSRQYFKYFLWLMFAGDVVKLLFFRMHDFNIAKVAKWVLYSLVFLYAVFYGVILFIDYFKIPPMNKFR